MNKRKIYGLLEPKPKTTAYYKDYKFPENK